MKLKDFFEWVIDFNYKRGWDLIPVSMAFVHLSEELGELAEIVVKFNLGQINEVDAKNEIAGEAADAMILVIKLAQVCRVDLLTHLATQENIYEFTVSNNYSGGKLDAEFAVIIENLVKCLGELARHVNFVEKFKDPKKRTNVQHPLVVELAIMFKLLLDIAKFCDVDLNKTIRMKMEKIAKRFDPSMALGETKSYLVHSVDSTEKNLTEFQVRFEGAE